MPKKVSLLRVVRWMSVVAILATSAVGRAGSLPMTREQIDAMGLAYARAEITDWVPVAWIPATVELAPEARVIVAARHEGNVRRTRIIDGDEVVPGQPLLEVVSADWSAALAAVGGRAARLVALERQAIRSAGLLEAGVIAPREDEALRAELAALRAEVRADGDVRGVATLDPSGAVIVKAPVAGRIVHRAAAGTTFPTGSTLVEIATGDALMAEGQAPARLAGRLVRGMRAVTSGGATGEVVGIASAIDPSTRALAVAVRLPAGSAVPGALVELEIQRRADGLVVRVPASAPIAVSGRDSVFVRGADGIETVPVEILHRDGREAFLGGVAAGSEVVTRGVLALKAVAEGDSGHAQAP